MHKVVIHYTNGSSSVHPFKFEFEVKQFVRFGISYSGEKVRRVEWLFEGSTFAMWDRDWDLESQHAGLWH